MPWVKAEYAGELAVVAAWIAALVPWSITLQPSGPIASFLFMVRWPLFELQVRIPAEITINGDPVPVAERLAEILPGFNLFGSFYIVDPVSAATGYGSTAVTYGGYAWIGGTVVVLAAIALSVALYRDEDAIAAVLPVDHVRLMAGLLGVATVAFAAASFFYWSGPDDVVGVPVPVGVAVVGALAIALARVERV